MSKKRTIKCSDDFGTALSRSLFIAQIMLISVHLVLTLL